MCMNGCVSMHVCVSVCECACVGKCMSVWCACVCMYVYTCLCIFLSVIVTLDPLHPLSLPEACLTILCREAAGCSQRESPSGSFSDRLILQIFQWFSIPSQYQGHVVDLVHIKRAGLPHCALLASRVLAFWVIPTSPHLRRERGLEHASSTTRYIAFSLVSA